MNVLDTTPSTWNGAPLTEWIVEVGDNYSSATLSVAARSAGGARDLAVRCFAGDRARAGLAPVDLHSLTWTVTSR